MLWLSEVAAKYLSHQHVLPRIVSIPRKRRCLGYGASGSPDQSVQPRDRVGSPRRPPDNYVHRLVGKAETLTVGNPMTGDVSLGPLIDANQRDRVHALPVEQPLVGSPGKQLGSCRDAVGDRPTVLAEAGPGIPAYDQEVFGPVAYITRFSTLDEGVKLATDTEYGLALGIFIADVATAHGGYWNPPG
jgi:acyl-CoA reductase-like NAD-dependent aldehyde dehydrogenase